MPLLTIGSRTVSDRSRAYVIAEIGSNGQGSVSLTRQLIKAAADAGASAVKLQKRDNPTLYVRSMLDKPYGGENAFGSTYGAHRSALEFDFEQYTELKDYAAELGIDFFATAFDIPSLEFLLDLGVPAIKLASGSITNTPLIEAAAEAHLPLIMSTGTASMHDVDRAVSTVLKHHAKLTILQCTAVYPAAPENLHLRVIETYRGRYPTILPGLSSHAPFIWDATAGYALGARVIEKHLTLSRCMRGTDHAFSLEPNGFRALVEELDRLHAALGDGFKRRLPEEAGAIEKMGSSLYAARPLAAGTVLAPDDIAIKTPGGHVPPYELPRYLGVTLMTDMAEDEPLPSLGAA